MKDSLNLLCSSLTHCCSSARSSAISARISSNWVPTRDVGVIPVFVAVAAFEDDVSIGPVRLH